MGKKSGSGSGMNNPEHISESLETIFRVKILKLFDTDPGSGMEKNHIRYPGWKKFGSGIAQHCVVHNIKNSDSRTNSNRGLRPKD
jgi:hypothetical protein